MKFKKTIYDMDDLKDIESTMKEGDIESTMKEGDLVLFEGNNQYDVSVYIHRNGILEYDTDLTTAYKKEKEKEYDLLGGKKIKKGRSKKNRSKRHRTKKNKAKQIKIKRRRTKKNKTNN